MKVYTKDVAAGMLFVAVGLYFIIDAAKNLTFGTAFRMGPGYFPVVVGALLICLGLVIALQAIGKEGAPFGAISWRGVILTTAAFVVFGLTVQGLGLLPSLIVAVLLSAYSSRRMTAKIAFPLAVGLAAFCALVFKYALGLPLQLIGPWLGA